MRGAGARATHRLAAQHEQPVLLVQQGVGGLAHVADDVVVDVAPQDALKHLGQEAALDDKPHLAVQVAVGAQLREQVGDHMLRRPVHGLAQVVEVDEYRLLGALTQHLGRLQDRLVLLP